MPDDMRGLYDSTNWHDAVCCHEAAKKLIGAGYSPYRHSTNPMETSMECSIMLVALAIKEGRYKE
jgi:hypothetical protein